MPRKLYVYDDEAKRQLTNKNFVTEFNSNKIKYVQLAKVVYKTLTTGATPARRPPLKGDVQAVLAEYLYSFADFTEVILSKIGTLERGHQMWCGYFAAFMIESAWPEISAGD
mgnify:CR=1 FL=1